MTVNPAIALAIISLQSQRLTLRTLCFQENERLDSTLSSVGAGSGHAGYSARRRQHRGN
jgi:hypothetical protein